MSAKVFFVLCAQAVLIQSALSQCTSRAAVAATPGIAFPALAGPYGLAGAGLAYGGIAAPTCGLAAPALGLVGPAAIEYSPTSGGALPVSSASAIAPVGISVVSDNVYEGALSVAGELPFVGTVAFENVLPTAGSGAVNHACGNGVNAMISDAAAYAPAVPGYAPAVAGFAPAVAGFAPAVAGFTPAAVYTGCAGSYGFI